MNYIPFLDSEIGKIGDTSIQTDNNETVEERPDAKAAKIENDTFNCGDKSSTNVQNDEIKIAANELSSDENVTVESSGEDEPVKVVEAKINDNKVVDQKDDGNECELAEPSKINDFDIVKGGPTADIDDNSLIVNSNELKCADGLCNGDIEKGEMLKEDSNIEMSTVNGEQLTESLDATANIDVNFDQIFDNLPENSKTVDDVAPPTENNVQSDETVPDIPKVAEPIAETDASETNKADESKDIEQTEEIQHVKENEQIGEPEKSEKVQEFEASEEIEKTNDTEKSPESSADDKSDGKHDVSFELSLDAEDDLLKSPSMNELSGNISTEYTESMLLKDDSKIDMKINDEVDTEPTAAVTEAEVEKKSPTASDEPFSSDNLFDQLKAAEALEDSNKPEEENNLLEEMAGSPNNSIDHCMDGGSMSSARDGDDNEFSNSLIDLKDDNSNDARDGFENDDKINISSDLEMMDQASNSDNKNDTNDLSNVSRSIEEELSAFSTTDVVLELQDSIDSSSKSSNRNSDDVAEIPEKSNESVIAIDDDDDDDTDSSTAMLVGTNEHEPRDNANVDETKDTEEPPAKRMRVSDDAELIDEPLALADITQTNDAKQTGKAIDSSDSNEKSSTEEQNVITAEPTETVSVEEDTKQVTIEDDDDDIVIVESNEVKPTTVLNSNKRPASPLQIEPMDDTRKKHKLDDEKVTATIPTNASIEASTDTAVVATATDIPATEHELDHQNDANKTEALTVDIDSEKKPTEESTMEKTNSVDQIVKSPKIEDIVDEQYEELKPVKKVELETDLQPKPEQCEKRSIALDFAAKFKKSLAQMSRKNLEEFVLVKITEAIVHKSELSELKQKSDAQEQMIQTSRVKLAEIGKQYRDLEMVYARLKKDLENRNQNIVTPIKITRAVGLQVSLQKDGSKAPPQKQPVGPSNGTVTYTVNAPTVRTAVRPDRATAVSVGTVHQQRLTSALAAKPITHIQRQPVRQAAIRQIVPEQPRLAATTGIVTIFYVVFVEV